MVLLECALSKCIVYITYLWRIRRLRNPDDAIFSVAKTTTV